jgi:UDP-N-acetylmuramoyl-L-alanyl-D-glutamate--2,6-diaminopimelate ligase
MRDEACGLVATEVSSHALAMQRVTSTRFAVVAFTNLSQDHLDFHGDMETYYQAKKRLFTDYETNTRVVNVDDPSGRRLAAELTEAGHPFLALGDGGDVEVSGINPRGAGTSFTIGSPWGSAEVKAPVLGAFNVDNVAMAVACAAAAGLPWELVVSALPELPGVPGRYELVSGTDPITIIVDYAHTPAGISNAIETARSIGAKRVIALVGAGGDRDRDKRPLMGRAASAADVVVVTSDNPRSEDPGQIIDSVVSGVAPDHDPVVEVDRRKAIRRAIESAVDGDTVLILGRGHEPRQESGGESVPFDDREVARAELMAYRRDAASTDGTGSTSW